MGMGFKGLGGRRWVAEQLDRGVGTRAGGSRCVIADFASSNSRSGCC